MSERPDGAGARRRRDAGFTLLEVLVAFAVAAPALALLYSGGAGSIEITRTAAFYQQALSRAQSRLDLLVDGALTPGERDGDDGGGFLWRTSVGPVATLTPSRSVDPRGASHVGGATLYAVSVEVSWPAPGGLRSVTLDTRRLGPASAVRP